MTATDMEVSDIGEGYDLERAEPNKKGTCWGRQFIALAGTGLSVAASIAIGGGGTYFVVNGLFQQNVFQIASGTFLWGGATVCCLCNGAIGWLSKKWLGERSQKKFAEDVDKLKERNQELKDSIAEYEASTEKQRTQNKRLRKNIKDLKTEKTGLESALDKEQKNVEALRSLVDANKDLLARAEKLLKAQATFQKEASQGLDDAQAKMDEENDEFEEHVERQDEENDEFRGLLDRAEKVGAKFLETREEDSKRIQELTAALQGTIELEKAKGELEAMVENLAQRVVDLEEELKKSEARVAELTEKLEKSENVA